MAKVQIRNATPVTFAAGAPIDADALNTVVTNIQNLVADSAGLANTVDGTSSKVTSASDVVSISSTSYIGTKTITLTTSKIVQIFIQPRPPINSKNNIAIATSYEISGQSVKLVFFTNKTFSGDLDFDYMVVERVS